MVTTDRVVIVGAGLSGLWAALRLAPRPVLVISPETLGSGASSAWAQGGIAAAMTRPDSAACHASDTVAAGAGIVDAKVAEVVTGRAEDCIQRLLRFGAEFDRDKAGNLALSREAAHSFARVVRAGGDESGRRVMDILIRTVRATPSIQVLERFQATRLEVTSGRVSGVWVEPADGQGALQLISAPAVLLAAGGSGGLFAVTTNPTRVRGQALGMAARAGAVIADAEFVQFHPTAILVGADPAPLATEALRGEGAHLINAAGERFMLALDPGAELAPRDIVARAIFAELQAGRRPMLDARAAVGDEFPDRFPTVFAACMAAGIDPRREPIPVAPAAHYHMGGVETDLRGRSSLPGLWASGEAACTGLHGANRLASNGLLEAMVLAELAADDMAGELGAARDCPTISLSAGGRTAPFADAAAIKSLRTCMSDNVGVIRTADGLTAALDQIAALGRDYPGDESFENMLAAATMIASAALLRRESRGAHCRADFPQRDPAQAHHSRLILDRVGVTFKCKAA